MNGKTLLPDPSLINLERFVSSPDAITVILKTKQPQAFCSLCQQASQKVHSRYRRKIADLAWQGVAIRLDLTLRRFFCLNDVCSRKFFAQPLPSIVKPYARKTARFNDAVTLIGFAIGGQAGATVAKRLSMIISPDTLLRRLRQSVLVERPTPKVLGVDDWAFRKGQRYGTILIDLEKRCPIDLLKDREAETLRAWLATHPGVEVISRDRATSYAEAAPTGAPQAIQIADRWHLLKNLSEALDRLLSCHHQQLREAGEIVVQHQLSHSPTVIGPGATTRLSSGNEQEGEINRRKRLARYRKVIKLHQEGSSMHTIAKVLGMGRETVRRFIRSDGFPERALTAARASRLEQFLPFLHQRWAEGCSNARQLWREIKAEG